MEKKYTSIAPIDIRVTTFCDYLIDTYIDENATFSLCLRSSFTYQAKEQIPERGILLSV
jgi:hypothetical protein